MGYGIIPNYKDENLVCQNPCTHRDCQANREDFITHNKCIICGKELEIGQAFYYEGEGKYDKAHRACVMEQEFLNKLPELKNPNKENNVQ